MDAGESVSWTRRRSRYCLYPLEQQRQELMQKRSPELNLDRFIPNRSAMDFDFAHFMLTQGPKRKENSEMSAYQKRLSEALNMNRTRILAFRNRPSAPTGVFPRDPGLGLVDDEDNNKPEKPQRRHIRQTPDRILDAPDFVDDYCLNLLDWGSSNVVAIALNNSVYLRDFTTGNTSEMTTYDDEIGPVSSVSWAPDGCQIAIGLDNSQVELWDSTCNKKLRTLSGCHRLRVGSLAWNDLILTTGGLDGCIVNNDVRVGSAIVHTYRGHQHEVCGLKWSPSGQQLASGGNDNLLHIWDISVASANSPTQWLHRLVDHTAAVKALAWCPFQRNLLASGGGAGDQCIKFWNTRTGACLNSVDTGSEVSSLLWNNNERELLGSHGKQLTLWKYPSMAKVAELTDSVAASRVVCTAQSPDGCTVASIAGERLCFWNVFGNPTKVAKPAPKSKTEPFAHFRRIR